MNKFLEDNVLGLPKSAILNIKPDDILLISTDDTYTQQLAEELGRQVKHILPNNKVMIVPKNVEFRVLPSQAEVIFAGVTE